MSACIGAYACVAMLAGFGIIAFRDPNGIRPCGFATRKGERGGTDYLVASESVVAQGSGFFDWEDVNPGEAIIITREKVSRRNVAQPATFAPDIFEYVYFARPDSTIDGISVYRSRMAMGEMLAETAKKELAKAGLTVDVVIPVSPLSLFSNTMWVWRTYLMKRSPTHPVLQRSNALSTSESHTAKDSSRTDT